ncbi:MAG: hypothetical protein PHI88_01615 [Candidatus Pacebacteria bacterium]|nr:hypothetical protein [Candidatus Paceibacterota bacterium]
MMVFLFAPKGKLAAKVRQHFDVRCGEPLPLLPLGPYFLYRVDGDDLLGEIKPTKVMNGSTPRLMEYRRGREIYHEEVRGQARLDLDFFPLSPPIRINSSISSAAVFFFALYGKRGIVGRSLWIPCEMESAIYTISDFIATEKIQRERIAIRN